ncbi:MAG: hypothetical protein NT116_03455 [Candidatus Parcubacteria bacterium]|nr:hypothetical protein [Candidatus Parcubacteria bacterium]
MKVKVDIMGPNCIKARVGPKTWRGSHEFKELLRDLGITIDRVVLNSEEVDIFLPIDNERRKIVVKEIEDFLTKLERK